VVEESKQEMLLTLEQRIQENRESLAQVITRLQTELLLKADTPETTALAELKAIKKRSTELTTKANDFKVYEETLGIPSTPITEIDDFAKKFDVRNKLWTNKKTLEEERQGWYNNVFVEQDVLEFQDKVKKYNTEYT